MRLKILLSICLLVLGFGILSPSFAAAQDNSGFVPCGSYADHPCQLVDVFNVVVKVTNFLIDMAGIIAVFMIVFAGYSMVVAAGNAEAVAEAKKLLEGAVIGFFIVMAAFALTNFLIFGGKGLIKGEPTVNGEPASILRCPVDYILGNDTCNGTKADNSADTGGTDQGN